MGPRHAILALVQTVFEAGRSAAWSEIRIAQRFGGELLVDAAASPLLDAHGKPDGVVLMLRDRTVQSSLQQLVSEREALEAFGRIAAGVAHEVKNPLGGIRGAAEITSRASDAKTLDAAELIVREVDRIAALVDDLMVFTHAEDLRVAPVNIHCVLDGVLDLLVMDPLAARVGVERRFDPSIPELLADADRLTQVFLNLARNALQAMEGRAGTLTITTRMSLDHHLFAAGGEHTPTLLVEVGDTGAGIPPALLERLATPFFTTRPGGTGLGLAVSRHWVTRHGGTLRIESAAGEGTCVRVALPLRRAP
jgi:two-component system nitrogen regulation sensor histidine kinase GlnL